jgi:hypothetical protein
MSPVQQSVPLVQVSPFPLHVLVSSPHVNVFGSQNVEQQSVLPVQLWPLDRQAEPHSLLLLHTPEQHSEPLVHAWPLSVHWSIGWSAHSLVVLSQ